MVGVRRRGLRLAAEQRLHVVGRPLSAAGRGPGVARRRAGAADRAVRGGRTTRLTPLVATATAAAAEAAATADTQLGDVAAERRRRGEEQERASGEEGVVEQVDDGAREQDRRPVGDRAVSSQTRVGHQQERVKRQARQQEDGVRHADDRELTVRCCHLPNHAEYTPLVVSPVVHGPLCLKCC